MLEEIIEEKEAAFANSLAQHVGKWVAIFNYGSDEEIIVSSGKSIKEARSEAEAKGFKDVTFFKVPPSNRVFIPSGAGNCVT